MRTKKKGAQLEMYVMEQCSKMLMELPKEARAGIVEWLFKRVVPRPDPDPVTGEAAQIPLVPDPRQLELPKTDESELSFGAGK